MAKKLSATRVREILSTATRPVKFEFIIEISTSKNKKTYLQIVGKNGEPFTNGEILNQKASAEYMAARLIDAGLRAKYKDLTTPVKKAFKPLSKNASKSHYFIVG